MQEKPQTNIETVPGTNAERVFRFLWEYRAGCTLVTVVVYVLGFFLLYPLTGPNVGALSVLPIMMVGWGYGTRTAFVAGLLSLGISTLFLNLVGQGPGGWDVLIREAGAIGPVAVVLIGVAIGKLSNLTQALQQEIHNHEQTEEELAKSQESLELRVAERTEELSKQQEILFEGQSLAKFGTIQRDLQTGEGWWSDEVYDILGIPPQKRAPTAEGFLEHVHPHDIECLEETIAEAAKTGKRDGEFRIIHSSGEELTVYSRAKIHYDEAGNPVRAIITLLDITERKQAEMKIQEAQKQLRALSRQLITAQETSRRSLALELHDELGQDLALLSIEIGQLMQKAPESQTKGLQKLERIAREISSQVHNLSHQLHPSSLEHLGLVAASRSLCNEVARSSGIQINFSHTNVPSSIPQDVSICLYRVLQESLTNILKHSKVQAAQVEVTGDRNKLQLSVCDSGVGFDPESVGSDGRLGFLGMRERLSLVSGELLIKSKPSGGTQITACVPFTSSPSPIEHPTEVQEA